MGYCAALKRETITRITFCLPTVITNKRDFALKGRGKGWSRSYLSKIKRTIDGEVNDFAEPGADPVSSLAQIKALVILLHPTEHQRAVRVYPQVLHVLVAGYVVIIARCSAATSPPRDHRWREPVGVTMQAQSRHPLRRAGVLRLHHPAWWH